MVREALRDCAGRPLVWISCAVQAAVAAALALPALTARPGYESALVMAPVASLLAGLVAAGTVVRLRRRGAHPTAGRLLVHVLVAALPGTLLALVVLVVAGLVRGLCDPWQGLGFFLAGPLSSAAAAAALATVLALAAPGTRWPHAAWIAALGASLAWDAALLYYTPQVFVLDHLLGIFAGPIYDEAVGLEPRHLVFRLVTLARVGALIPLAACVYVADGPGLDLARLGRGRRAWAAGAFIALVVGTFLAEPALGLRSSQREISRRLGGLTTTQHFIIHHPGELDERQVRFLEAEAELRFAGLEEFFEGAPERRLVLVFFRSAQEMRLMTGTGPTSVAKPWLGATYMVYQPPIHPILEHEMAHLFAARWGRGPFRTPGALMGILADPLILEGTAVAAEWDGDPLDPHTTSAAIVQSGLIDDPAALEGIVGFYSHAGGLAYVMSGSLVRHLWSIHGPGAVKAWYSGSPFEEAFGTTMREALDGWVSMLRGLQVPPRWAAEIERRYGTRSVFERPCPHEVARLVRRAAVARVSGDVDGSIRIMDRVCTIAPADPGMAVARLRQLVATRRLERARAELSSLLARGESLGGHHAAVTELAGDIAWCEDREKDARRSYSLAFGLNVEDSALRMLSVKLWAVEHPAPGRELRDYLLGTDTTAAGDPESGRRMLEHLVGHHPGEPLLAYLLGRAYLNGSMWKEARGSLERALAGHLDEPLIKAEALRLLAVARLWSGDRKGAVAMLATLEKMPPPSPAMGYHAREWKALAEAMK